MPTDAQTCHIFSTTALSSPQALLVHLRCNHACDQQSTTYSYLMTCSYSSHFG